MKKIKLTQGKFALVDDEDFEWLNQYKWFYKNGYPGRRNNIGLDHKIKKGVPIYMHRVINNTPEGFDTDHINRNKLDNRRENLRSVTRNINQQNTGISKNNTSGFKGVSWNSEWKKWKVQISNNKKVIYLGFYTSIQEALFARIQGEQLYWNVKKEKK